MNPQIKTNGNEPPAWAKALIAKVAALEAAIAVKTPDADPEDKVTKPVEQIVRMSKDAYPVFQRMEARQAAYDKRNPHIKKGN